MKFVIQRTSVDEITIDADSEQEAMEIAREAGRGDFCAVETNWCAIRTDAAAVSAA